MARRRAIFGAALIVGAVIAWWLWRRAEIDAELPAASSAATSEPAPPRAIRYGARSRRAVDLAAAEGVETPGQIGALEGRVVSRGDGRGVPGARVQLASGELYLLRADADGHFAFQPPRAGSYELAMVSADGFLPFAPELGHSPMIFEARAGVGLRGVEIFLDPEVSYTVLVLDARDGPVAGARVHVLSDDARGATEAPTTDARGEARLVAADGAVLEATHADHPPGRALVDTAAQISKRVVVRLGEGGAAEGFATLRGRVVDDAGQPVPDALVSARYDADNPALPGSQLVPDRQGVCDELGQFELERVDAGRRYAIVASAPGLAPAELLDVTAPAEGLTLTLGDGVGLYGTVREAGSGAPIASFVVMVGRPRGALEIDVVTLEPTLDAEGRYHIPALPPGPYRVMVSAPGFAPSALASVELRERDEELSFELGRGGVIRGQIVDGVSHEPIAGARATLEGQFAAGDEQPLSASSLTGADGRYRVTGVGPGLVSIFAAADGHHARVVGGLSVREGQELVQDIELTPLAEGEEPRIELCGIGAVLSAKGDVLLIGGVIEGGGAAEVGLGEGDGIVAIDGLRVAELGFDGSIQRIRGPEGTIVRLLVQRAAGGELALVDVPRRRLKAAR